VVDGETGMVVRDPRNVDAVAESLRSLLGEATRRNRMAMASRARAVAEFDYGVLVSRLAAALHCF